jgi:3-phosphoshikimate 1-carboxyvinyltransferase
MTGAVSQPSGSVLFLPPQEGLRGTVRAPGDKSVSHRAVLLGAVNDGPVDVHGFLGSADTLATVAAVRALGVEIDEHDSGLTVRGRGWAGLREPEDVIYVANSGTLIRLLPGLVASCDFHVVLTGDPSIRRRPMARVLEPLAAMGATVAGRAQNTLPPVSVRGGRLQGMQHRLLVASGQVKSCLVLAGLRADGETTVSEPGGSRDHTERLVRFGGGRIERDGPVDGAGVVHVFPVERLRLPPIRVPGDLSSAAFFIVGALLVSDSDICVENVGLNPTRTGLLRVLERMGADIQVEDTDSDGCEPVGRIRARTSELQATDVEATEVPAMIDELPLFLLAAARARGTSRVRGAAELRLKESDRLGAMAGILASLGAGVVQHADGLEVTGVPGGWSDGRVQTVADHRLAMVGAIAGLASRGGVMVDDVDCIAVSYPGFVQVLRGLGGRGEVRP